MWAVTCALCLQSAAAILVQPGAGTLQAALNGASAGDELVLADGLYTGNGINVLDVNKSIMIRALNAGQAVLDGQNARRVVNITTGNVTLQGLNITRGASTSGVRTHACPTQLLFLHACLLLLCGDTKPIHAPKLLHFA